MKTLLIVLLVLAVAADAVYVATKYFNPFKDEDKDGIPAVVEDKYADVKEDVEDAIEDVKEFAEKAKDKVEDIVEEVKDLPKKVTRKKPGRATKKTAAKK